MTGPVGVFRSSVGDDSEAQRQFHRDMVAGAAQLKRISYNPTRLMQIVGDHGGAGATLQLLRGTGCVRRVHNVVGAPPIEMSNEAFGLLPWYQALFSDEERRTAE
jgi:hypothetical protein